MDLDGCAALVTGGSGDIGAAITRALAAAGADVAVTYLSVWDRADSVTAEVAGMPAQPGHPPTLPMTHAPAAVTTGRSFRPATSW